MCKEEDFVMSFSKKDIGWLKITKRAIILLKEFEKTDDRYNQKGEENEFFVKCMLCSIKDCKSPK